MSDQDLHFLLTECSIEIWREKILPNTPKIGNGFALTDKGRQVHFGLNGFTKVLSQTNALISFTVPKTLPAVSGSFFSDLNF